MQTVRLPRREIGNTISCRGSFAFGQSTLKGSFESVWAGMRAGGFGKTVKQKIQMREILRNL